MKKNLHIILTLVLTPVLFYLILEYGSTYVYCGQLSGYDYDDFKIIGGLIKLVLVFLAICGGGTLVFFLLKKLVPAFKNKYAQVAYIMLLWTLVFYPRLRVAIQNHNDAPFISGLCDKTTGNVMQVKSINVTYPEYQYLQGELVLLPDISSQSDSIQIDYYHDGFLPDFSLHILFRVPVNEPTNPDEKHWFEKSRDSKFKWLEFRDSES